MKNHAQLLAAVLAVGSFAIIGCDNNDAPTVTTETKTTQTRTDSTANQARDEAAKVKDAIQDAGHAVADKSRELGHDVAEKARDARDGTTSTTQPADAAAAADGGLIAQAQELYNKATSAITAQRLDEAQGYVDKLKELRDKLPAEWQTRVDQLVSTFDSAKAKLNALPNVQMPK